MRILLRVVLSVIGAAAGGMLCSFYWSGDDAGSWTPWWEVIAWLALTFAGILAGLLPRFPSLPLLLSAAASFATPMLGMVPVAVIVHFLKKKHPEE